MLNKFDTNPLDPEFPERAKQQQAAATARQKYDAETTKFPNYSDEEIPTRSFNDADFNAYSSVYNESQPMTSYKTARLKTETAKSRKVSKVGLPENILVALPYLPFHIGLVAGILELIFVPKSETKVRFHAAQGLAAQIGILLVTMILGIVGNLPGLGVADAGNWIFQIFTTIMLIVFAVKAWKGEPVHIESVDSLTEWFEDKIKPQN
ncbi:MAG: hypothetical protein ACR2F2_07660 [Pyrinomonadaceae bacterium]